MSATEGFEAWYRLQHPSLLSSLTAITGDPMLANDVADEAFARACERWPRVRAMRSPGGWTYRTALNVLKRQHRRRSFERRVLGRGRAETSVSPPPDWSAEVCDALRLLPPRERTAIVLRHVADLPVADIALAMGVAAGTVASTLHDARGHLALLLTDPAEVPDG